MAVIVSIAIITAFIILIVIFLYYKTSCAKKEEKPIPLQIQNSELVADDIVVCDSSRFNEEKLKNTGSPVYSVVSELAKMSENQSCKANEEKNDQMAAYSAIVGNKEEVNSKDEMQDTSYLYAVVDKNAKSKEKSQSKDEMQGTSNLYDVVDESAKKKKKSPEETTLLYATVDKIKKTKQKTT